MSDPDSPPKTLPVTASGLLRLLAPILQRLRAMTIATLWELIGEARVSLWHGLLAAAGSLPILALVMTLWTWRRPPLDVFVIRILLAHSIFCFALGCVIIFVGAKYELLLYFWNNDRGLSRWYKDSAGLAVVGAAGLVALKVVITLWPRLLP